MAPMPARTLRSTRRPHTNTKSLAKRVKFAKSNSPIVFKKPDNGDNEESYANIVLHYLSKLKVGLFGQSKNNKLNSKHDAKNCNKPILKKDFVGPHNRHKARDIVNAAIQYGCANNLIERMGDCFMFKDNVLNNPVLQGRTEMTPTLSEDSRSSSDRDFEDDSTTHSSSARPRHSARRATPGPEFVRCSSCKSLTSVKKSRHHRYNNKPPYGKHLCSKCCGKRSKF